MGDERLRELERRARDEGTVEAEAAWTAARLRSGELAWDDVALDAYLGHAPAQVALGEPVAPVRFEGEDVPFLVGDLGESISFVDDGFNVWLRGFAAWGPDLLARALLAHACVLLDTPAAGSESIRQASAALERWCGEPTPAGADEVIALAEAATPLELSSSTGRAAEWTVRTFSRVLRCLREPHPGRALLELCVGKSVPAASVREVLRRWPLAPRLVAALADDGRSVRVRAERAITPPARRALIERIWACGRRVTFRLRDGTSREVEVGFVSYERVTPLVYDFSFDEDPGATDVDLDEVVEVAPAPAR